MVSELKNYTIEEVAKHNQESDCWVIISGKVFDMTSFLNEHPGGKKVVLKVAGKDATKQFNMFHDVKILSQYSNKLCIGHIGGSKVSEATNPATKKHEDPNQFGDLVPHGDPSWYQSWNSPYYKDSHKQLRTAMRAFVEKEIIPFAHEWNENNTIPKEVLKRFGDLGLSAAFCGPTVVRTHAKKPILDIVEPSKFDAFHWFVINDELARCGSGGITWALNGGMAIGLPPVVYFGSKYLQDKVVADCLSGNKFMALAITEPYAGSDVANIQCSGKLTEDGKHFIVNGEKKWITNGTFADFFTVAVRTTDKEGNSGISLLLVERSMPGVQTRQMKCSGVWGSGTAFVTLDDVKVPVNHIIGKLNQGFKCIMYNFNNERLGLAILANRFSRVCYEEAFKYAHQRKTFGKRLVDHAVIRNKLAHMARHIEATHNWLESVMYQYDTMDEKSKQLHLGGPIALLKAQTTQTFAYCATEATQIFGGLAYTRGGRGEKVERLYRDVRAFAIPGGSEEIMLDFGIRQAVKLAKVSGAKL